MPSNRRLKPAAEKRSELIAAATKLFIEDGYESSSMIKISKKAGVTPNTIYWYFADKDELLLAVLDELLSHHLLDYRNVENLPLAEQLYWFVQVLEGESKLMTALHSRIKFSDSLNEWHNNFHKTLDAIIESNLSNPLPASARDSELRIVTFALEGLVLHEIKEDEARDTCNYLATRLNAVV